MEKASFSDGCIGMLFTAYAFENLQPVDQHFELIGASVAKFAGRCYEVTNLLSDHHHQTTLALESFLFLRNRGLLCLQASLICLQAGECILRENEELTTSSKFYLVQTGTVECFKHFKVSLAS